MDTLTQPRPWRTPAQSATAWRRARDAVAGLVTGWRDHARIEAEWRAISELSEATRRDLGLAERGLRLPTTRATHGWTPERW
jgi:hypothetical protein